MFPCLCEEGDPHYNWLDDKSLEIKNVTRKDAGVYTVKCTNEEGVNETTVVLDVQCKKLHVFTSFVLRTPVDSSCVSC